jgi:PTH1 family peptidyl-tRNA hydrolase
MTSLIVFLGNPGSQYCGTRHNLPWILLDEISCRYPQIKWEHKNKSAFAKSFINDHSYILLKPLTFINKSGESVRQISSFFKIPSNSILVVHDHIDFPFGTVKITLGGGLFGHNGLRSIASLLGTNNFYRFSLGISRPEKQHISSWVLSKFRGPEKELLPLYMQKAADYLLENEIETLSELSKTDLLR